MAKIDDGTVDSDRDDKRPATAEEWASINFEPWAHADDEWTPPTNEEWREAAKTHLVTVRLAWAMLYRTKAELVQGLKDLGDEYGNQMMDDFVRYPLFRKHCQDPQSGPNAHHLRQHCPRNRARRR
jgi:hypothetical protein